jgi:hypothetical protein
MHLLQILYNKCVKKNLSLYYSTHKYSNHTPSPCLLFTAWTSSLNWPALNESDAAILQFFSCAANLVSWAASALSQTAASLSLSLILRPTLSRLVCLGIKHPSGAYDQICITVRQLWVCWCGALSLTRGWVCHLQLLLALASEVILGSEYCWTRDHILLSQIWDIPFCHFLQLAGLRWRYSTPPPNRINVLLATESRYIDSAQTYRKHVSRIRMRVADHIENTTSTIVTKVYLPRRCLAIEILFLHTRMLRECVYQVVAWQWVYTLYFLVD